MATPGSITNIKAIVNEHEASIVELKTLRNLRHDSIGIMWNAFPENPSQIANGGTAIFRRQKYIQSSEYTAANRESTGDLPASEIIKVDYKTSRVSKYEIETLALPMLAIESRSQFLSYISKGLSDQLAANLDAYKIRAFLEDAKDREKKYITAHSGKTIKDLASDITQDDYKRFIWNDDWNDIAKGASDILQMKFKYLTQYMELSKKFVMLTTELDRYNLGSSPREYFGYGHQHVFNQLMAADGATLLSTQQLPTMSSPSAYFAFLGIPMNAHPFMGKDIPKNTSFNKDEDFLFSPIYGIIAHGESCFVATQGIEFSAAVDPNSGNQKYVMKYNLFEAVIRPLYIMLVGKTLQ